MLKNWTLSLFVIFLLVSCEKPTDSNSTFYQQTSQLVTDNRLAICHSQPELSYFYKPQRDWGNAQYCGTGTRQIVEGLNSYQFCYWKLKDDPIRYTYRDKRNVFHDELQKLVKSRNCAPVTSTINQLEFSSDALLMNAKTSGDCSNKSTLTVKNNGEGPTILTVFILNELGQPFKVSRDNPNVNDRGVWNAEILPGEQKNIDVDFITSGLPPNYKLEKNLYVSYQNEDEVYGFRVLDEIFPKLIGANSTGGCMHVSTHDAQGRIDEIGIDGRLLVDGKIISDEAVKHLPEDDIDGFVNDGNSRLFIRVITPNKNQPVKFQLKNDSATNSRLVDPKGGNQVSSIVKSTNDLNQAYISIQAIGRLSYGGWNLCRDTRNYYNK